MKSFIKSGLPLSVQQDGWWLSSDGAVPPPAGQDAPVSRFPLRLGLLLSLIALGDVLVWQVVPGLSLAVFGAALIMASVPVAGRRLNTRRGALVSGGSILALLPLVELVQPLSILIAVTGLSILLALIAGLRTDEVVRGALRLWPMGAAQSVQDCLSIKQRGAPRGVGAAMRGLMMRWVMPLALGLLFAVLLLDANPVAQGWLDTLATTDLGLPRGDRFLFWLCLAPLAWTALSVTRMRERLRADMRKAQRAGPERMGLINPGSVVRALVLFNAVFALQTGMDAIYLYGGVGLPDGISHAEYAHRGAYPLVVTALLAGGFALLARRWILGHAMLRWLMIAFVAQNIALVISSLVRLDLYVGVYGLTHLRLAAAIWMAMVAGGLGLILWQVWRGHGNGWLMLRGGVMAAVVLYLCAFLSFDAVIARHNLTVSVRQDQRYLCRLGDAAKPVIRAYELDRGRRVCNPRYMVPDQPRDWREWGFRNWRARHSLTALTAEAAL